MVSEADPAEADAGPEDEDASIVHAFEIAPEAAGGRVDKVLAAGLPELSRARLQALIAEGRVSGPAGPVADASE
jgi:23S rRNA pseudouridine1911/1915/1917 synthase